MQSLFFWKGWSTEHRIIWFVLTAVFILSVAFMWHGYFRGNDAVIHWEKLQEQKMVDVPVHSFELGPFALSIPGESYVIFEYFSGSNVEPNTTANYFFLLVMALAIVVLLAVVTTLSRFWYLAGMTLFIVLVVSLRLEVLRVFGFRNMGPSVALLTAYMGLSFYFHSFRSATTFTTRLVSFFILTLASIFIVYFFAEVAFPIMHLGVTAYTAGMIVSAIFIIMVAHEIFASFVFMTSQGHSKSLRHFGIIIVIWFANLFITYLHAIGSLEWNFIYLNLYLLLTVSAILGIWGFRQRENLYEGILSFYPFGAYLFISLGAIAFAFVGSLLGNANDAALQVIRDLIIYSQLGYGLVFLLYVLSNFLPLLDKDVPIYRILYKSNRMPYFTFRLGGFILVIAFIMYSDWRDFAYRSMGGYFIGGADLYTLQGDNGFAEALYEQASSYAFQNHRSNYSLASIQSRRFDLVKAHDRLEKANAKSPSEYSLTNTGNLYIWEKQIFKAIDAYSMANRLLPNSGAIQNNLGFAYTKVHALDSAAHYLSLARKHEVSRDAAEANFFAMAAMEYLPLKADSVVGVFQSKSPAVLGNALALSSMQGRKFEANVNPLTEKKLDLHTATLLNNYIIQHVKNLDTAFTAKAYRIASDSVNEDFSEAIKAALAVAYYHQGNVSKGLEILAELSYISSRYQGKYNYIMGLWALEQGNPVLASSFFSYAETQDYRQAKLYNAIALTEAGRRNDALIAWDTVANGVDTVDRYFSGIMKRILTLKDGEARALNDADKYQFCRYRITLSDSSRFNSLINTFTNSNYKAQALLDRARKLLRADKLIPAIRYMNQISGLELTNKKLFDDVRFVELEMLASRGEIRTLARQINQGVEFDAAHKLDKLLYTALISESSGDLQTAKTNYEIVGRYNPYFETGILAAVNFFRNQDAKSLKSYDILAEAIQVNSTSIRLLKAYVAEAARIGFDDYAASAAQRLNELETAAFK
ncbi:MAG: hypothetical protein JNM57_16850 [Cyclobacteriaceae bacterium]|nr:hypothetical protein [Cyclobacteriaceae bacterium]